MTLPKWTVNYNIAAINEDAFVGQGWEFFATEAEASACYKKQVEVGNYPCKRPYYHKTDRNYLHTLLRGRLREEGRWEHAAGTKEAVATVPPPPPGPTPEPNFIKESESPKRPE